MRVAKKHSNYKENNSDEKVCYNSYRKIFASIKITFTRLVDEEYKECEEYKKHDRPLNDDEPEALEDNKDISES